MLGWKYVAAEEESQRYKVGKFILETKKTCSSSRWENEDLEHADWNETLEAPSMGTPTQARSRERAIEFDSQDEDECEDLFAGVWSPALATKRRQGKRFGPGQGPGHSFQYVT